MTGMTWPISGSCAMASRSCAEISPIGPPSRGWLAPRYMMVVPMEPICSTTRCLAPSPTASITMTEATPITIPSSVKPVRARLMRMPRHAVRAASASSAQNALRECS
ncbi:hypothetical protein D3C72_2129750 [compost metagenome]